MPKVSCARRGCPSFLCAIRVRHDEKAREAANRSVPLVERLPQGSPRERSKQKAMVNRLRVGPADLGGRNRLTIDGIAGIVDMVEAMHYNIASVPGILAKPKRGQTTGITSLVYRSIRGVLGLVGRARDKLLARLDPWLGEPSTWPGREALLAALNGVLGDYLAASNNPLAITMALRRGGLALRRERARLAAAILQAGGQLVVLLHGLCMNDLQWKRKGHDHGAALARDLGYTPVYLHYNSGLHVSVQ